MSSREKFEMDLVVPPLRMREEEKEGWDKDFCHVKVCTHFHRFKACSDNANNTHFYKNIVNRQMKKLREKVDTIEEKW